MEKYYEYYRQYANNDTFLLKLLVFILIINLIYALTKLIIDIKNNLHLNVIIINFLKRLFNGIGEIISFLII